MNRIILASHGGMAAGARGTVEMILGEQPNLYAVATERDEVQPVKEATRELLKSFAPDDKVYILTDIKGGSVNNDMMSLLPEYPQITLICGMNLALIVNLASMPGEIPSGELAELLQVARDDIVDCSALLQNAIAEEEDDL